MLVANLRHNAVVLKVLVMRFNLIESAVSTSPLEDLWEWDPLIDMDVTENRIFICFVVVRRLILCNLSGIEAIVSQTTFRGAV